SCGSVDPGRSCWLWCGAVVRSLFHQMTFRVCPVWLVTVRPSGCSMPQIRHIERMVARMSISRRFLMGRSASAGVGCALLGSTSMLAGSSPAAAAPERAAGFGPLVPDPAGILDLPRGFRYRIVSRAGQRLAGHPGVVPGTQDGMASFAAAHNHVRLVNNHEQEDAADYPVRAEPQFTYDPGALGGTTTIEVDGANRTRS